MTDETTPPTSANNLSQHLRAADIRGIAQLATQGTLGVTSIVESAQQSIWSTLGLPGGKEPGTTRGITGMVFQAVQGITQLVGQGADAVLTHLQPLLEAMDRDKPESPQRAAVLSVLNGVIGDKLNASSNPLATPMSLRYQGQALNWQSSTPMPLVSGKVLVLVHGLCMNDLQWNTQVGDAPPLDHGTALADALGYTPVYARYNSGLHTSQNGRELSEHLQQLVNHWPVPVQELTMVVHSMGGLVTRSAVHYAQAGTDAAGNTAAPSWLSVLKNIVFLGTPHHGAPLERAGNWVDVILGSTPYTKPYAKLGHVRSAGITDLRYGYVADEDWQNQNRFHRKPDNRLHVALPEGVQCFTVAATAASHRCSLADRLVGDGLVPLKSALGQHDNRLRTLAFPKSARCIAYSMNHMELLSSPEVNAHMVFWLSGGQQGQRMAS